MSVIINPGSGGIAESGDGWTNTEAGAIAEANDWLATMRSEGVGADVELLPDHEDLGDGRWRFSFRHTVTGVVVDLCTHGINDMDAYLDARRRAGRFGFAPRVYWNGSSSSTPRLDDWSAPGFVQTYRAVEQ